MSNLSEVKPFQDRFKNMRIHTEGKRFSLLNNSDNISLLLLRSNNTLNSKLKVKAILINKSLLLLTARYLEATLTFLRFAAKHRSIAELLLILINHMLHILNSAKEHCLTERANHTLCLKSDLKSINLRITKYNGEKQSRFRPP